jgi:general L-amino acid transport system substrate-binding protein
MSRKSLMTLLMLALVAMFVVACGSPAAPVEEEAEAPVEEPVAEEPAQEEAGGSTLAAVQARGKIICGGNQALPGFGSLADDGSFTGFDIDYCKALAAAIFGDSSKFEIRPLTASERFTALQTGEIDVLIRNTTWTLTRDTDLGGNFVATTFYDGQGMMVRVDSGITTLEELDGATVCVQAGTTTELNLADVFAAGGINYTPLVFETADEVAGAYEEGRCDSFTTDKSGLVSRQTTMAVPADHVILDATMSKEPLGPMVRHGDDQWFDIVQWVVFATFQAEESGISSANVADIKASTEDPTIQKLLGVEEGMGALLGLDNDWAYNIISQVGNYAEIYDRNLGPDTPTYIPRGLNSLYTDGGILYAPPIR